MTNYERNILFTELRNKSDDKWLMTRLSRMEEKNHIPEIFHSVYTVFGIPEWAIAYWEYSNEWPEQWKPRVEKLMNEAKLVEQRWEKQMNGCPEDLLKQVYCELDTSDYKYQPVFCAVRGERPKEWDYLHIGGKKSSFSRCGCFYEIRRGDWLLMVGFDHD